MKVIISENLGAREEEIETEGDRERETGRDTWKGRGREIGRTRER